MNNLTSLDGMLVNIALLTVFKNFLQDEIGIKFTVFLESVRENGDFAHIAELYSDFVSALYKSEFKGDFSSYVRDFVLTDENIVSKECAKNAAGKIPPYIMGAFDFELRILSDIASVKYEDVREILIANFPKMQDAVNSLPMFDSYRLLFTKDQVQNSYKTNGYGIISKYSAFKFDLDLQLRPVILTDNITFDDLKLYDYQKNILKNNTCSFIKNSCGNNVLLYGDRGCGKSSSVHALLNKYKNKGLKIVQVYKENLEAISELTEYLSDFPSKFIIFIDDLVFNENEQAFSACKAALEGSLSRHPSNVLFYATSNRRHLIKETYQTRIGDEVHINDTLDEAASLSDRFGITITYTSPDKKGYLEIVKLLADEMHIAYDINDIQKAAEQFALLKGNRTPRIAKQFILDYFANNRA
ncbi:MAG: ATP-binding protein [Candidatus Gastranaerophilales bacterium]|nr:ATP-binding protein [Candidatus Gastranaerophilales bacterium]